MRALRFGFLLALLIVSPRMCGGARGPTPADSMARARTLRRWARESMADTSVESRQRAARDLRRSLDFDPSSADAWLALGQVHELGRYGHLGRRCFRQAILLAPREPEGWLELGRSWKRDWLRTLDPAERDSAAAAFESAASLSPRDANAWLDLVPLRYEKGDVSGAEYAANRALAGYPRRPEALLAVGYVSFRRGDIDRADSAFAAARGRLDPTVRALFDRPAWIGLDVPAPARRAGAGGVAGRGGAAGPWDGLDPDPATPANEVQLEYQSRVAHALLLFADPLRPELDSRAETYVRYGPPASTQLNPYGAPTNVQYGQHRAGRSESAVGGEFAGRTDIVASLFPADAQVWSYPQLGMRVVLQDRSLSGHYTPVLAHDVDPSALPDRRLLARRGDLLALGDGVAVFPTLPPRDQALDVRGTVARFETDERPRLVAHVQAPGGPADRLLGRWLVRDSTGREIARDTFALDESACDPGARRVGQFSCALPPGAVEVCVSARDRSWRRGFFRIDTRVPPPARDLTMSDIVLACGNPSTLVGGSTVRIEANIDAVVDAAHPLVAYFEIYRLTPAPDGVSRFAYDYTVRREADSSRRGRRTEVPVGLGAASREESFVGTLRRQFVTLPSQPLAPGRYRLGIRVRDLVAGTQVESEAAFERR